MKTILNLIILNLIQIILTVVTIMLISSCAADIDEYPPLWVKSLETLPRQEGYRNAGMFGMEGNVYAQFCDSHGNVKWLTYNKETHTWKQTKYETHGCKENNG